MDRQAKPIAESGYGASSKGTAEYLKPEALVHRSLGKGPLEAVAVGEDEAADVQDKSDMLRADGQAARRADLAVTNAIRAPRARDWLAQASDLCLQPCSGWTIASTR